MKYEYKEKVLENLNAINSRIKVISEMITGEREANTKEAVRLSAEIEKLVELSTNIVDLS